MLSTATMRLVSLLVIVGMGAACGRGRVALQPLEEPLDVRITWSTYRFDAQAPSGSEEPRLVPVPLLEWRLEFLPDSTFRYAWRDLERDDEEWQEVSGTLVRCRTCANPTWNLVAQGEVQHVDNSFMGGGQLPMVYWSSDARMGDSPSAPSMGATWWIQVIDPATGRFTDSFTPLSDPRSAGG